MIERHVTFELIPEKNLEFEKFFTEEYRPAMSQMPGFIRVELLRLQNDHQKYQMVIRFNSEVEAAVWRGSPAHQALQPKIKPLYRSSQLQVYDVIS